LRARITRLRSTGRSLLSQLRIGYCQTVSARNINSPYSLPDWDDLDHWHNSGLWDLQPNNERQLKRILNEEYSAELRYLQQQTQRTVMPQR